jgi:microcystin-dependent protein
MPTDTGGTYSLPSGSAATTGTTILASEHNTPLNDIASALTARLPVDGSKGMSGVLKVADGTVATPSISLVSDATTGFFKKAAGVFGFSSAGTENGQLPYSLVPTGAILPFAGSVAPSGWVWALGTAVSRTTYAALFAVIGTTYGAGDGSTTFNLPDLQGRVIAGYGSSGRLTTAGSGVNEATLGSAGGAQNKTIGQPNLPNVNFAISATSAAKVGSLDAYGIQAGSTASVAASGGAINVFTSSQFGSIGVTTTGTAASGGSGTALPVVQPTIVLNYIIKT